MVDDGAATRTLACAPSLPVTTMCEGVLNRDPLAQFAASLWGLLTLA